MQLRGFSIRDERKSSDWEGARPGDALQTIRRMFYGWQTQSGRQASVVIGQLFSWSLVLRNEEVVSDLALRCHQSISSFVRFASRELGILAFMASWLHGSLHVSSEFGIPFCALGTSLSVTRVRGTVGRLVAQKGLYVTFQLSKQRIPPQSSCKRSLDSIPIARQTSLA